MNLIQNACDATAGQSHGRLSVRGEVSDEMLALRVADNGSGIAKENLGRLFEAFL